MKKIKDSTSMIMLSCLFILHSYEQTEASWFSWEKKETLPTVHPKIEIQYQLALHEQQENLQKAPTAQEQKQIKVTIRNNKSNVIDSFMKSLQKINGIKNEDIYCDQSSITTLKEMSHSLTLLNGTRIETIFDPEKGKPVFTQYTSVNQHGDYVVNKEIIYPDYKPLQLQRVTFDQNKRRKILIKFDQDELQANNLNKQSVVNEIIKKYKSQASKAENNKYDLNILATNIVHEFGFDELACQIQAQLLINQIDKKSNWFELFIIQLYDIFQEKLSHKKPFEGEF